MRCRPKLTLVTVIAHLLLWPSFTAAQDGLRLFESVRNCDMATGLAQEDKSPAVLVHGACVLVSGSVESRYQESKGLYPFSGSLIPPQPSAKMSVSGGLDITRSTDLGPLKSSLSVSENRLWSYNGDGLWTGQWDKVPTLSEASASYLGFKVGYSSSLMGYWAGDFLSNTNAPDLSAYLVTYELDLSERSSLAFGIEGGPPTAFGLRTWKIPNTPPYLTSRYRYTTDDWTFHFSFAVHMPHVSHEPLKPRSGQAKIGYASVIGLTAPLTMFGDFDTVTLQGSYSVNSPRLLGSSMDRAMLNSFIKDGVPPATVGWSFIASYEKLWTEKLTSNFMVSYLGVNIPLFGGTPTVNTTRAAANSVYQITKNLSVKAEVAHVKTTVAANDYSSDFLSAQGINQRGARGQQTTYIVSMGLEFP